MSWLARCPAPYRYPIWRSLAETYDLRVFFLQERGLGRTWRADKAPFDQLYPRSFGIPYGEDALWFLNGSGVRAVVDTDVVVFQGMWESPSSWQALRAARRRGARTFYFSESTLGSMHHGSGPVGAARQAFFGKIDGFITPGSEATAYLRHFGVPPEKIATSVSVVDIDRIRAAATDPRCGIRAAGGPHSFVTVARLLPRKNVASVIRAFATMPTDTELHIVGDGDERPFLERLTSAMGLSDRVTFHGALEQQDVYWEVAKHHTLVHAPTEEVWGMVVNEALALGLHAVVSDVCGCTATFRSHQGVWATGTDPKVLAHAMRESIDAWTTWIPAPEILAHNGSRFAADLVSLVGSGGAARTAGP